MEKVVNKKLKKRVLKEVTKTLLMGGADFETEMNSSKICSQTEAILEVLMGKNVFLSGPAGAGKTATIKAIQDIFYDLYDGRVVIATTATTGVASTLLPNGKTLHSWSGMLVDDEEFKPSVDSFLGKHIHINRIKNTDILIIDEISMLSADNFIKLDAMLKYARRNEAPFGGIQVIFSGDFLQLPPVITKKAYSGKTFAFETKVWEQLNIKYCFLDRIHRSKCKKLSYVLHHIAEGEDPSTNETLRKLLASRFKKEISGVYSTLFTTNKDVEKYNLQKQAENSGKGQFYYVNGLIGSDKEIKDFMKQNKIEEQLYFKEGDTVMITQNFKTEDGTLIPNGLIVKILNLDEESILVEDRNKRQIAVSRLTSSKTERNWIKREIVVNRDGVRELEVTYELEERVLIAITQFPLRLAYAITVHKSQGQTFDGVVCDLSKCFTTGLGYVSLSRAQTLDSIVIEGLAKSAFFYE